jgi:hypothetical protein
MLPNKRLKRVARVDQGTCRFVLPTIMLALALLTSGACSDKPTERSGVGFIQLNLQISGDELDPNGFLFVIDGRDTLALAQSLRFQFPAGEHTIDLRDVANNCEVTPGFSQTFDLASDAEVTVTFAIVCADLPGSVAVEVATSGSDPDRSGYVAILGTGANAPIPPVGSTVVTDVPSDSTTVTLSDVAPNCGIIGRSPPHRIRVLPADTVAIRFEVVCGAASALDFAGTQLAQLSAAAMPDLDSTWTVELWFSSVGQAQYQVLVGQWQCFEIATWRDAQGRIGYSAGLSTAQNSQHFQTGTLPDTTSSQWRHVAVSYDRGQLTVYFDGEARVPSFGFGASTKAGSPYPLVIGGRIRDSLGTLDAPYNGRIDEVRIWRSVRTPAEIRGWRDVHVAVGTSGLIGYWSFDEGSGMIARDSSGQQRDLSLTDPAWITPGRP